MVVYICTKCHENILDGTKVMEPTLFSKKKSKGNNSINTIFIGKISKEHNYLNCRWSNSPFSLHIV